MSRFRTGRLGRLASLGGLATRLAGGAISSAGKRITAGRDAAAEALHRKTAQQLLSTMGRMKGLPMKVGQLLSFMDGVVPGEYQPIYGELLAKLQVRVEPMPWEDVRPILERELGAPCERLFRAIDPEPLAAASIGQVHRGELPDGQAVAIKIQYPGIDAAVQSDLKNANALVSTMSAIMPIDNRTMVRDFLGRIGEELDYRNEARNQRDFGERWRDEPRVVIPEVVAPLSSQRVLVSHLMRGETFAELCDSEDAARKSAVGEVLFTFVFRSLLTHGIFNADPHPGNYLFGPGDRVIFLDFGCVQRYDEASRAAFRRLIEAILEGRRGEALWRVIAETLEFPDSVSLPLREIIEDYLLYCFKPALDPQPFRYTRAYTSQLSELTMQMKLKIFKNLFRIGWKEPKRAGLVMLSRILFGMNSLLAALEAEGDWRARLLAA